MNARDRLLWLILSAAALAGCTSMQRAWYRCDARDGIFRGWDYKSECDRLERSARGVQRELV